MGSRIACFFIEPTDRRSKVLRRFTYSSDRKCPRSTCGHGGHDASFHVGEVSKATEVWDCISTDSDPAFPRDGPRWPAKCRCGYSFRPEDNWQIMAPRIYVRSDNGQDTLLDDAGPGALYYADYYLDDRFYPAGPDGHVLCCNTPGGLWIIDSRASNCTMPGDNEHRCWVRQGDPKDPTGKRGGRPFTVGKDGLTCEAGAG